MQIRPASSDDLTPVRALLESLALPTAGLEDQFPAAYAVATRGGGLVGCGGLETYGPAGLLRSVAVASGVRYEGIGRALVADRLVAARTMGLRAVYVLTKTARDYFARIGFTAADRATVSPALASCPEFAIACPASASCLVLRL
jgi:amino-acid N-acetyltransferase